MHSDSLSLSWRKSFGLAFFAVALVTFSCDSVFADIEVRLKKTGRVVVLSASRIIQGINCDEDLVVMEVGREVRIPLGQFSIMGPNGCPSKRESDSFLLQSPSRFILIAPRSDIDEMIADASIKYGVHERLLHALIQVESSYQPEARSPKGAMGLMQLMPQTARRFGVKEPYNPQQNIDGGTRYLKELLDEFKNVEHALAAYNAGEEAVRRYGGIPPYPETRTHVRSVIGLVMASPQ